MLKVEPYFESGYFFFTDCYLILISRFYMQDYFSIKIRSSMQNGINANNHLPVGTEKKFRVELFFEAGKRKVYDMLLSTLVTAKVILFSE